MEGRSSRHKGMLERVRIIFFAFSLGSRHGIAVIFWEMLYTYIEDWRVLQRESGVKTKVRNAPLITTWMYFPGPSHLPRLCDLDKGVRCR